MTEPSNGKMTEIREWGIDELVNLALCRLEMAMECCKAAEPGEHAASLCSVCHHIKQARVYLMQVE